MSDLTRDSEALRTIARLIAEGDNDAAWEAVAVLHRSGGANAFNACRVALQSTNVSERQAAIRVLAQLDWAADRGVSGESVVEALRPLLVTERDAQLVSDLVSAFGWRGESPGLDYLAAAARHPNEDVRFSVATSAPSFPKEEALPILIGLLNDESGDVRNWAAFGVGTQLEEQDSPEIRAVLLDHVEDEHDDARMEAIIGLARRKDMRVLPFLQNELLRKEPFEMAIEAADLIGDARLIGPLRQILADYEDEGGHVAAVIARLENVEEK